MYFNSFFCFFFNPVLVFFPGVHKYLLSTCYIPATVLGSGATKLNKTDIPAFTELMWSLSVLLALLLSLTGLTMKALLLLLSRFSRVRLCATPQMAAYQAPLSLGFSGQEYWSGLPLPSPNPCYNPPIISIAKDFSPKARQVLENLSQLRGWSSGPVLVCIKVSFFGLPRWFNGKEFTFNAGDARDVGWIPALERSSGVRGLPWWLRG